MCCARCAVELFEKSAPGCFGVIYMEIMMPRMNGWDAARTIRAMNRPDAEIIPILYGEPPVFTGDKPDLAPYREQEPLFAAYRQEVLTAIERSKNHE